MTSYYRQASSSLCTIHRSSGRPELEVSVEEIEYFRALRFSWTKIAELMGISRSTLYRRLQDEGIDRACTYSSISDSDLDRAVTSIKQSHPNDGERLMIGHLHRIGIIVQRWRVRASIHRVDPVSTALRRSRTIRRRVYSVEGPNSLWHIDGNHKLIKWRFVIHGGIDGYSRSIVFLHCSTNNLASTVLSSFHVAVSAYGVPDQIRSDLGGENVEVWRYMIEQKQSPSAVVVGSSTHNQRIERLWRDVTRCVSVLYGDLFRKMEEDNRLNSLNEVDLFCLHSVFLPRLNRDLEVFMECWNNHPLSTANNLTPNQLFIRGAIENDITPTAHASDNSSHNEIPSSHDAVDVPRTSFNPCHILLQELEEIDVMQDVDDFGYSVYLGVCNHVGQHLVHCNSCS